MIANSGTLFDISAVLPESSPLGSVLSGMFGFRSAPTPLEVVAYFAYLIPVLTIYMVTDRTRPTTRQAAAYAFIPGYARDVFRTLHQRHLPNCTLVRQIRPRSALPVGQAWIRRTGGTIPEPRPTRHC